MKKRLAVLGATGSIGCNTLKIAAKFSDRFTVTVLTAKRNVARLSEQIRAFAPEAAAVYDREAALALRQRLPSDCRTEILHGPDGYRAAAEWLGTDMVVSAMVGAAGLMPTLAAIAAGKDIALANKETLVMAGGIVTAAAARHGVRLIPVDSEHSAIFQCLQGQHRPDLERIILTASGGPFRCTPADQFATIRPEQALKHPNWRMGAKITIDSATLMNKGLEVIEARWLFGIPVERIDVLVHPQSVVHSMVALCDGSVIAQLGVPDMQGAIAYALSYPRRLALEQPPPDLAALQALTFEHPDFGKFPCLTLAIDACREGGTLPAVLNAANEVAVDAFLSRRLPFTGIYEVIHATMADHLVDPSPDLETLLSADAWARRSAKGKVEAVAEI